MHVRVGNVPVHAASTDSERLCIGLCARPAVTVQGRPSLFHTFINYGPSPLFQALTQVVRAETQPAHECARARIQEYRNRQLVDYAALFRAMGQQCVTALGVCLCGWGAPPPFRLVCTLI